MTALPRMNKITFQKDNSQQRAKDTTLYSKPALGSKCYEIVFQGENDLGILFVNYGQISLCIPESDP